VQQIQGDCKVNTYVMLSACIFEPIHYHLMSHFNTGLSILHIHICKMEDNTEHVSLRSQEEKWVKYLQFIYC